jgi:DNA-binding helix-turn-helix protein
MKGLSTAIRERAAERGLTQAAVARAIGIGRQTFSRKINGRGDFSVFELTSLAAFLGTTVVDLMRRADQIAHADETSDWYAIKDERSGVVILQARRVDIGGEAA